MNIQDAIDVYYGKDKDNVKSYYVTSDAPRDIRFIVQNGKSILQYKRLVHVKFFKQVWSFMSTIMEEKISLWIDVPVIEEDENEK